MDFKVEVDSRENCFCSISRVDIDRISTRVIRCDDPLCFLYVLGDGSVEPGKMVIGRDFAQCLKLRPSSLVRFEPQPTGEVGLVTSPIVVSPSTPDDWEVVESQSQFLESNILSQVKLMYTGMKFPVWVGRGQRPIYLTVTGSLEKQFEILQEDSELAVEARKRIPLDFSKREFKRGFLPLRVTDTGFPRLGINTRLFGVGMIVHHEDFKRSFGPESGCLMTVRDRPDILTVVACDSTLVDEGVALIAPWMRDRYGLVSGERIVLEQQERNVNSNLIVPSKVFAYFPSEVAKSARSHLLRNFIRKAGCVIVPQGGWMGLESDGEEIVVQFRFGTEIASSRVGAILAWQFFEDFMIDCSSDIPPAAHTVLPRPFLKYVPEKIRADAEKFQIVQRHTACKFSRCIPSFAPLIRRIRDYMESALCEAPLDQPFAGSVLLTSPSGRGSGKTTALLQSIDALSPSVTTLVIDCIALADASRYSLTDVKLGISGLVRFAFENPPFCLFFDNIDSLIPGDSGTNNSESAMKRGEVIAEFLRVILRDLKPNRSLILAATALTDSVSLAKLFTHHERLPSKLTAADRELLLPGAAHSEGHSMMELVELAATGTDNREKRKNLLKGSKTLVSNSVSLGGLDHQIQLLVDAITLPLKFPSLFTSNTGESIMATGAFIVGPSGTGKTALIDHVVRLTNLPVEIVRGPDLLDKYIGASEQGVRRVFEKAAAMAPCLVVFDTIDALCPRRGSESTGVTDRVVNQMLCYLDGVEKVDNVFVIAVSSRPDMVDPALTRPGRLDLTVLCDIPTHSEREEIIKVLAKEFGIELKQVDVDSINSSIANGLTGADLRAGFVNTKILSERRRETGISFTQLLECLREIKPSISERDAKICDQVFAKYRKTNPPIKASPQIGTRVLLH